jgi:hypothetical protein
MVAIDPDYLAALRANAEAVRADLEERQSFGTTKRLHDPEAEHDAVMAATRVPTQIFYKTNDNARVLLPNDDDNGDDPIPPLFTDEQLDLLASVLAEFSMQQQSRIDDAVAATTGPLKDRIATLEGSINTLMAMLNDNNRSIETPKLVHVR